MTEVQKIALNMTLNIIETYLAAINRADDDLVEINKRVALLRSELPNLREDLHQLGMLP